ncbi:inovirus-type Gp2 protein [Burkholderia vietnamiensis]|uniref:inovirus-type Gp2 protein n=1 Tax=Burkholderia vietnamiensis TaxID=60552 RepID=UPI0015604865|nr:inovirus-type Gp2 protein [Burkholderia vietnamiensis]
MISNQATNTHSTFDKNQNIIKRQTQETPEDIEAQNVIAQIDERLNLEQTTTGGKIRRTIHSGYASRHLFTIEKFVKSISTRWTGGFVEERARYSGLMRLRELYLGKNFYRSMNDCIGRFSCIYRYSSRVEVFYDVCREMGLLGTLDESQFGFGEPEHVHIRTGMRYFEIFNILIEKIRARVQSREFIERERLRQVNAMRRTRSVLEMEETMFSEETGKSRWLVLSLTLRIKPEFRRWITPEEFQRFRGRFFAARRYNRLMKGIANYVWAIEQSEGSGLHLHVILFYDAGNHNHDEFIAQQIGEYWSNAVTIGKGEYWNSNQGWLKPRYARRHGVGVGQINWNEREKREALRTNLVYLAKADQYLMSRNIEHMHTFDMGHVPKKVKAGRPRTVSATDFGDVHMDMCVKQRVGCDMESESGLFESSTG